MTSGVFCIPKSNNANYASNTLIIDRFNQIFGILEHKVGVENMVDDKMDSLEPSSFSTNLSEEEKWQCGTNVRAPYSEDEKLYEAIIEKIFDDYAVVRFLGYENEEAVKLKDLRPSLGEESITEQIENALNCIDECIEEDEDDDDEESQWKVGMYCRALYEPNEVIYEAMIERIDEKKRTADVVMLGYGIPYQVDFDHMYKSIPELRSKQELNARTAKPSIKLANTCSAKNKAASSSFIASKPTSMEEAKCSLSGVMQPTTENDALACLLSSNYLSGYYAGFFDAMRKFQITKK